MWHFKEERKKRRKIREKEGTKKEKKRRRRGRGREEKDWEMVMGVEGNAAARRRCRWLQRCPGSYSYFIGTEGRRRDSWQLPKLSYSICRPNKRSDSIVWSLRCRVPPRLMPGGLYSTAGFSTVSPTNSPSLLLRPLRLFSSPISRRASTAYLVRVKPLGRASLTARLCN